MNEAAKRFAVTGVAGYVAPRHLKAITETGNRVVAALDPHDGVGILDRYGLDIDFFTEPERFERYLLSHGVDWLTVCSPNHLHDAHVRMGLRADLDVLCEKPLALSPWNLDAMEDLARVSGRNVFTVLQLRIHPVLVALKARLDADPRFRLVALNYTTPRGRWYQRSWKGDEEKSGGLVTNIGIHLLDLVLWLFGSVEKIEVGPASPTSASGRLSLARADVTWRLSVDGDAACRNLIVDGEEIRFDDGFADLHTEVYRRALDGKGFTIADARPSVELAYKLRRR